MLSLYVVRAGSEGIVDEEEEGRDDGGTVQMSNVINVLTLRSHKDFQQIRLQCNQYYESLQEYILMRRI